jgi:hypothetical protein
MVIASVASPYDESMMRGALTAWGALFAVENSKRRDWLHLNDEVSRPGEASATRE